MFQQYFSHVVAASFIGIGNQSTRLITKLDRAQSLFS